jgi:hypothetical protein
MTLNESKKKLGKLARGVPDDVLLHDIEVAQQLAKIYFSMFDKKSKLSIARYDLPNVP